MFVKLGLMRFNLKKLIPGAVVILLLLVVIRFFAVQVKSTHYHTNFALYVNGVQDKFDNFTFYEEVATCDARETMNPKGRAHMHDRKNHVVHVHADGVTWGHFFANLGYGLSDKAVTTDAGVFAADGKKLTFMLNGQMVDHVANKIIGDTDILLISYGEEDQAEMQKRFDAIPKDAKQLNETVDPASCAGAEKLTFPTRLKRAVQFWH